MLISYCIGSTCIILVGLTLYFLSKDLGDKDWIGAPWWFIPEAWYETWTFMVAVAAMIWPAILPIGLVILAFVLPAKGLAWVIKKLFYNGG